MSTTPPDDPRLPDFLWDNDADLTATDHEFAREFDELLESAPMAYLTTVSRTILLCDGCAELFVDSVDLGAARAMRAVCAAAQWLLGWVELEFIGIDLPVWLLQLDAAEITSVRSALEPSGCTSYLIEVRFADAQMGTVQVRVDPIDGAIINAFAIDDPVDDVETIRRACMTEPMAPYAEIDPSDALETLTVGLGRCRVILAKYGPANPWPSVEPLVSWVLRQLDDQLGQRREGQAT